MATRLMPKKAGGDKPAAGKATAKKGDASKKAAANGPAASAGAGLRPRPKAFPTATIRALTELETGELNRYADADEMFRELGHRKGPGEATRSPGQTASAIGARIVKPDRANLTPEAARASSSSTSTPRTIGGWTSSPPRPRRGR